MEGNKKTAIGLAIFVTITIVSCLIFKLIDKPNVIYEDLYDEPNFETYSIVLENDYGTINVRPFTSDTNLKLDLSIAILIHSSGSLLPSRTFGA